MSVKRQINAFVFFVNFCANKSRMDWSKPSKQKRPKNATHIKSRLNDFCFKHLKILFELIHRSSVTQTNFKKLQEIYRNQKTPKLQKPNQYLITQNHFQTKKCHTLAFWSKCKQHLSCFPTSFWNIEFHAWQLGPISDCFGLFV